MKRCIFVVILVSIASIFVDAQEMTREVLDSSVVVDYRARAEKRTQVSMMKIEDHDFQFKSVLCAPDIVKTLQMLPGVIPGNEMSSTMNIRGGIGTDNLYLMDNVPIYQSGHFLGIFSVFNSDIVKSVDFYKGGFPAEYGGRTSSVVDIKLDDGSLDEQHVSFSAGVTDARFQIEGPIKVGKSSYNIAFRYGWVEAFLKPILRAVNVPDVSYSNYYTEDGHYGFSDLNAKITCLKDSYNKFSFNAYVGLDFLSLPDSRGALAGSTTGGKYVHKDAHRWGNIALSSLWERKFSRQREMKMTAYLTNGYYNALYKNISKTASYMDYSSTSNISDVFDIGIKAHFEDKSFAGNYLTYGATLVYHLFSPIERIHKYHEENNNGRVAEEKIQAGRLYHSSEFSVYVEDEISISPEFHANLGLRNMLLLTKNRVYNRLEPRVSLSYTPNRKLALRTSYDEMNQPIHQIEAYESEVPGTFWMPATKRMKPIHSRQCAVEIDWRPNHKWYLNFTGFWKIMNNLYEYIGGSDILPSPSSWETCFVGGKGKSYGLEFYGEFQNERWELSSSYTLSWSLRNFATFYNDWYPDRYDNRHNIVLTSVYKAHKLVDMYATWTYRSGNRYTIPIYEDGESYIPNNFKLPAYHRLDVGIDFRAKTKRKGNDYTVSFSVYNLYGRKNPNYIQRTVDAYNRPVIKMTSLFPILPSIRYSMYF